ncbi:MAG: O-antigen ligase family protein [Acidimicrobiia bacterium]|nr:O-antigen ligase family protein [Acidimicrobiia bacterium]
MTAAGQVVQRKRAGEPATGSSTSASLLHRRRSMLGAVAVGVTCAALIRKGAFFLPDAWVFPLLLAGVAIAYRRRPSPGERRVLVALGAFCLWWAIASVAWGVSSRAPLLIGSAVGFGAALVIGRSFDLSQRAAIHRNVVALGAVMAALGMAGIVYRAYPYAMAHDGLWRVAGTLTYANAAGLLLAMIAPLAIVLEGVHPATRRVAIFLIVAGLIATESRGALFAFVVVLPMLPRRCLREALWAGLLALFAGVACIAAASGGHAQPLLALALVGLAVIAGRGAPALRSRTSAALLLLVFAAAVALATHPSATSRLSTATLELRTTEWSAAYRVAKAHPIAGGGPEKNLPLNNRGAFAYFAHNEYLQIAAGGGLVALALLGLAGAAVVGVVDRRTWQSEAATASLLIFAVGGVFDFTWHAPALGIVAGWIAALAFRGDR